MSPENDGHILREDRDAVVVLTISNAPARNSLTDAVLCRLANAVADADGDAAVRAIVIAGAEKVFASGADVTALAGRTPMDAIGGDRASNWQRLRDVSTPTVAAVSGFCLGGGAELAMTCDIVVCSPTTRFGLPETALGLLPGAGGTQLLPRAVGKSVAMDMVLTGRMLDAAEAIEHGLAARIAEDWLGLAIEIAEQIAARSSVAQRLAKHAVNQAFDLPLSGGLPAERSAFAVAFGSADAAEGMAAFLNKRPPVWTHT